MSTTKYYELAGDYLVILNRFDEAGYAYTWARRCVDFDRYKEGNTMELVQILKRLDDKIKTTNLALEKKEKA